MLIKFQNVSHNARNILTNVRILLGAAIFVARTHVNTRTLSLAILYIFHDFKTDVKPRKMEMSCLPYYLILIFQTLY